jgi:hypothetical protein
LQFHRPEWAIAGAIYKIAKSLRIASFSPKNGVPGLIYVEDNQRIFSLVEAESKKPHIFFDANEKSRHDANAGQNPVEGPNFPLPRRIFRIRKSPRNSEKSSPLSPKNAF